MMLNSRQNRLYVASGLARFIKNSDNSFSPAEILKIESMFGDEFNKYLWLYNVCNCVLSDAVFLSDQQIQTYLNDTSDLKAPKQNDVFEASERMIFLQEKLELLKLQRDKLKDLLVKKAKKVKDLKQKKSQTIYSEKEIENSLKEACFQLNDHLRVKPMIRDHKDLVEEIALKLDFKRDFNSWIQQSVEDLSLESGDEQKLVDNFLLTLHQKLKTFHEQLMVIAKELNKIKEYYLVEVKNEIEIRSSLKKLIDEIKEAHEEEHHTKDNRKQVARKRDLLSMKPGQLFTKYDHSEQDELELLTENLKKKIEILADDSFAYSMMNNTMRH